MRKIKHKRALFALVFCAVFIGGVAAALMAQSNTVPSSFEVHTDLPVMLAWNPDPSDTFMRINDVASGVLEYVNQYDVLIYNVFMYFTVDGPDDTFELTDFAITLGGVPVDANWNLIVATHDYYNTWPLADIAPLESGDWDFTFTPLDDGTIPIDGTWSVSMYLYAEEA